LRDDESRDVDRRIPANVSLAERASVTAGFAKKVLSIPVRSLE